MIRTSPIATADLPEVGRFLNDNLNKKISPEDWIAALSHRWAEAPPNHGMQLRDEGRLVGVFCAIYSDQWIDGKLERFCNPHSWCVLNEYRNQSISLILPLLKQPGYHFTMYTPNSKVAEIFRGLKFRDLQNGQIYFPNLPSVTFRPKDFLEYRHERIAERLTGHLLRDFNEHRAIRWLNFVVFGNDPDTVLLIYKRDTVKRLPCARIIHLSDPQGFERHGHLVKNHLLWTRGIPVSRIEARFISTPPALSVNRSRGQPKLVLTRALPDAKCFDIYSELAALDV